jgi:hypothetical protein
MEVMIGTILQANGMDPERVYAAGETKPGAIESAQAPTKAPQEQPAAEPPIEEEE